MSASSLVLRVAAKAVIANDEGQVLLLREAPAGKHPTNTKSGLYQLPGGKIEIGETFEDGLRREALEETGLGIEIGKPLFVGEWRPIVGDVQYQIIGVFVAAVTSSKKVRISNEHDDYQWIDPTKRAKHDIVAPDWRAIDAFVAHANGR